MLPGSVPQRETSRRASGDRFSGVTGAGAARGVRQLPSSPPEGHHSGAMAEPIPVLHYRGVFLNLTETFIARQLEGVAAAGRYEPRALCFTRTAEHPLPDSAVFAMRGVESPDAAPASAPSRSALARWKSRLRSDRRRWGFVRSRVELSPQARRWIAARPPAILHAHFGHEACGIAWLAEELRIPLVVTFYGLDLSMYPRSPLWRARYRRMFRSASMCLAEGGAMLHQIRRLGCPPEKTRVIRNPAPIAEIPFVERPFKDARSEPVDLLFVGRFVEKKGLVHAVRAMGELRAEFPRLRLNVVGDGDLRPSIEAEIRRHGVDESVILHGLLPFARMSELMRRCDALVVPSVVARDGDSEGGAPNILLDAQASGMPVVGTDHCDIPEFVAPDKSAFLAPEGDAPAFAGALRRLLAPGDPERWIRMGRAGREHVSREFDMPSVVARMHELYDGLLAANRGGKR